MPRIAYVNGSYVPHDLAMVHVEDRGFQFADSVYEVVSYIHGHLADERGHLDRLERSLSELGIAMPVSRRALQIILREVLRRNGFKNASIYLQVSRGRAPRDFPFPSTDVVPSLIVTCRATDFVRAVQYDHGVSLITVPDLRWKRVDIKTTCLLAQCLAKQEAIEAGAADAWMVDEEGFITEGSAHNAWIVKEGVLITRQADTSILKGVTRTAVCKIVEEEGLSIDARAFSVQEAYDADEAFMTSAGQFAIPAVKIDGHTIGSGKPGPVSKKLRQEYLRYVEGLRGKPVGWKEDPDC